VSLVRHRDTTDEETREPKKRESLFCVCVRETQLLSLSAYKRHGAWQRRERHEREEKEEREERQERDERQETRGKRDSLVSLASLSLASRTSLFLSRGGGLGSRPPKMFSRVCCLTADTDTRDTETKDT